MWLVWAFAVVVCGVAAAALLANHNEAQRLWLGLASLPLPVVGLALVLVLGQVLCQTFRLWAIIPPSSRISPALAANAFTLGECANMVVPGRAGDVVKAVLMNRSDNPDVNLSRAAGAVLADKVIDVVSVLLLCAATGVFGVLAADARAVIPGPWATVLGIAVPVCAVAASWRLRPAWFAKLRPATRDVVSGLSALKAPVRVLASVSLSLGAWIAELLALKVLCAGLGLAPALPQLMLAIMILNAGVLVPISLANVGVYEAALAFGLTRAGIALPSALAIAIAHHALELLALALATAAFAVIVRVSKPIVIPSPLCASNTPSAQS